MTIRAKSKQSGIFGAMALILAVGDSCHLIPRMIYAGQGFHPALGFGTFIASLTMTVFYVLLYWIWAIRRGKAPAPVTAAIVALAVARIALCLFPQNMWLSPNAPYVWGIYRNIPFTALGALMVALFYSRREDKPYSSMWIAISLSFAFYLPVVLFSDAVPAIGFLMLPKTLMYVWIMWMGFKDSWSAPAVKAEIP
jgi:hypothetical protein